MMNTRATDTLVAKVKDTLRRHRMIPLGGTCVVGVSGGPDSTALLHVLSTPAHDQDVHLVVAHVNHGLRDEAAEDERFVRETADSLGLPVHCTSIDVRSLSRIEGISVEEAGRNARYRFFEHVRSEYGADVIATAHHLDDAVETFFLRVFRGSSLQGLGGIAPVRGHIVRPFIAVTRSEILAFLEEHHLPFRLDATNADTDTDRNFLRNVLLPEAARRFPGYASPVVRTMDLIRAEDEELDRQTEALLNRGARVTRDCIDLQCRILTESAPVLQARAVLKCLQAIGEVGTRWTSVHVNQVLRLMTASRPSVQTMLPGGIVAVRRYGEISITRADGETGTPWEPRTVSGTGTVTIAEIGLIMKFELVGVADCPPFAQAGKLLVFFDADQIGFPLLLRAPQPGDRISLWGGGGTRKLKKILIDEKIPARDRSRIPLLVERDAVLWVPGIRRSSHAPVISSTARVLRVEMTNDSGRAGAAAP